MIQGLKDEYGIRNLVPRMQFSHPDYIALADSTAKLSGENLDLGQLKNHDFALYKKFLAMSVICEVLRQTLQIMVK